LGWYAREPDVSVLFLENTSTALEQNSEFMFLNFRGERSYVMEVWTEQWVMQNGNK
jgi:hypothetical protein